jgi:hypothetical protein
MTNKIEYNKNKISLITSIKHEESCAKGAVIKIPVSRSLSSASFKRKHKNKNTDAMAMAKNQR